MRQYLPSHTRFCVCSLVVRDTNAVQSPDLASVVQEVVPGAVYDAELGARVSQLFLHGRRKVSRLNDPRSKTKRGIDASAREDRGSYGFPYSRKIAQQEEQEQLRFGEPVYKASQR